MGTRLLRAIPVAALLMSACADRTDSVVELGVIEFPSDPPEIVVPATANRGEPFVVRVTTYGDGCVVQDISVATSDDDGADVSPYDRRHIPGEHEGCTLILRHFPHEATIMFETAGPKQIRVHGRRVGSHVDEAIEIPIAVVVE